LKKILPDHETDDCMGFEDEEISAVELAAILQNTDGCEKVDSGNITQWSTGLGQGKPQNQVTG
jgi:hypothetical protein